MREAMYV